MKLAVLLAVPTAAFLVGPAPLAPAVRSLRAPVSMAERELSEYEKYKLKRGEASFEEAETTYRQFKGIDQEFDGGDSGGGVVGDGNTDLQDQHNSATLGALRGGLSEATSSTLAVGRGNVHAATEARTASAGKNYFGRSTGVAEKLIEEMSEEDVKLGRMDKVRAQQKENWFNQRAIHRANRASGQGVVYGESTEGKPTEGGYIAREALASDAWRHGAADGEVSQRDLANHLQKLATMPAERLDGQEWGELVVTAADPVTETFELRASPRQTDVTTIFVKNDFNTFAPYRCGFVGGSSAAFAVTPRHGSMNRRSGEPVEVIVRT
ncbi:hypothetical protein AB1Y20_013038 [Prymnesium parvum]|uniref:Uncharacterized protein n=1 Tax=Prymnesium parvum TaxID=97485 RepID=A0AB34IN62_PRYPA